MSTSNAQPPANREGTTPDTVKPLLQVVNASEAPKPLGKFSQGIVSGNMIYLSGQMGQDPKTGQIVEGGVEAQANQIVRNIEACLKEAGTSLSRIVMRRTYVTDIDAHLRTVSAAWAKVLTEPYPAATAVQVGALALKDALVEIDVVAEMPN